MTDEKNNKNYFENPDVLKGIIVGLVCFILIIAAFGIGVKVGISKAGFSYRWADNYHRNFAGPRHGFFDDWRAAPSGDFINAHGSFGEVIQVNEKEFVVKGNDNVEKVIVIKDDTVITKGHETQKDGVKVGDRVVIIGSPNNEGKIEARFVRIFPDDGQSLPFKHSRPFPFS